MQALLSSLSSLRRQPFLDGLPPRSPPPGAWAAAPPHSALYDPIHPGMMIQRVLYKPTPLTWAPASPGGCLLAWGGGATLTRSLQPLNTCRPLNCPQPTLTCNLMLDLEFQLRCRGGRSDIKFQGLKIPPKRTFPPPHSPLSNEAEILTLRGRFSKLSNCLLHT